MTTAPQSQPDLSLAYIKRWWYLLRIGMWRGEQALTIRDARGVAFVGAYKGPLRTNSLARFTTRTFYRRKGYVL